MAALRLFARRRRKAYVGTVTRPSAQNPRLTAWPVMYRGAESAVSVYQLGYLCGNSRLTNVGRDDGDKVSNTDLGGYSYTTFGLACEIVTEPRDYIGQAGVGSGLPCQLGLTPRIAENTYCCKEQRKVFDAVRCRCD